MTWEEEMKFLFQWLLEGENQFQKTLKEDDLRGALCSAMGAFESISPGLTEILDKIYQCAVRIDEQRY